MFKSKMPFHPERLTDNKLSLTHDPPKRLQSQLPHLQFGFCFEQGNQFLRQHDVPCDFQ